MFVDFETRATLSADTIPIIVHVHVAIYVWDMFFFNFNIVLWMIWWHYSKRGHLRDYWDTTGAEAKFECCRTLCSAPKADLSGMQEKSASNSNQFDIVFSANSVLKVNMLRDNMQPMRIG